MLVVLTVASAAAAAAGCSLCLQLEQKLLNQNTWEGMFKSFNPPRFHGFKWADIYSR